MDRRSLLRPIPDAQKGLRRNEINELSPRTAPDNARAVERLTDRDKRNVLAREVGGVGSQSCQLAKSLQRLGCKPSVSSRFASP
jgi:hypothetical protein